MSSVNYQVSCQRNHSAYSYKNNRNKTLRYITFTTIFSKMWVEIYRFLFLGIIGESANKVKDRKLNTDCSFGHRVPVYGTVRWCGVVLEWQVCLSPYPRDMHNSNMILDTAIMQSCHDLDTAVRRTEARINIKNCMMPFYTWTGTMATTQYTNLHFLKIT